MSAMTLIETKTLGTAAVGIEFTSIPQTFTDLYVLLSLRTASDTVGGTLQLNGITTDFSRRRLFGSGSAASSDTATTDYFVPIAGDTANTFGNASMYIPNYTGSTNKSFATDSVTENNAVQGFQGIHAGLWSNTDAITSARFASLSGNFVVGSTISLYGILKGSSGGVTVS